MLNKRILLSLTIVLFTVLIFAACSTEEPTPHPENSFQIAKTAEEMTPEEHEAALLAAWTEDSTWMYQHQSDFEAYIDAVSKASTILMADPENGLLEQIITQAELNNEGFPQPGYLVVVASLSADYAENNNGTSLIDALIASVGEDTEEGEILSSYGLVWEDEVNPRFTVKPVLSLPFKLYETLGDPTEDNVAVLSSNYIENDDINGYQLQTGTPTSISVSTEALSTGSYFVTGLGLASNENEEDENRLFFIKENDEKEKCYKSDKLPKEKTCVDKTLEDCKCQVISGMLLQDFQIF